MFSYIRNGISLIIHITIMQITENIHLVQCYISVLVLQKFNQISLIKIFQKKKGNCNLNRIQNFLHFIMKLFFLENTLQGKLNYRFIYNLRSHPPKDTIILQQITYYKNTSYLMSTSYVQSTILNYTHLHTYFNERITDIILILPKETSIGRLK